MPVSSASSIQTAAAVMARGLSKQIDQRTILADVNLDIPDGAFVALLGANGAGKSSLLKIFATLSSATCGELFLLGQRVGRDSTALRRRIGMVGHQSMLYRDLTARENLVFFARLYGVNQPDRRAGHLLQQVGLADRGDDAVRSFSRGMIQRLSIARALVHDPQLILADEPFDGLDAPSSAAVLERMLADLNRAGKTIVLANHDIDQSLRLAGRAVVLRRGRVVIDETCSRLLASDVLKTMEAA